MSTTSKPYPRGNGLATVAYYGRRYWVTADGVEHSEFDGTVTFRDIPDTFYDGVDIAAVLARPTLSPPAPPQGPTGSGGSPVRRRPVGPTQPGNGGASVRRPSLLVP